MSFLAELYAQLFTPPVIALGLACALAGLALTELGGSLAQRRRGRR